MKPQTQFYLFTEKGITDRFFCGNIYEAQAEDPIRYHGCTMTFQECADNGLCKQFATRKEANQYSRVQDRFMELSNNHALKAMLAEESCLY
jgi:hypothetical protein